MQLLLTTILLPFFLLLGAGKHVFEQSVPADGVKQSNLTLEFPAGELKVSAAGDKLVNARVDYDRIAWKPTVTSSKSGGVSTLHFKQESSKNVNGNVENKWDVSINKGIPLALHIKMGAGDAKLNLSNSSLKNLTMETGAGACQLNLQGSKAEKVVINTGVGDLTLDLTGSWSQNLTVEISGGIGSTQVRVPKNTAVVVQASLLGSKTLNGFTKSDGWYRNSAQGKSKNTITLKISSGLGSVEVVEV